MSLNNLGIVLDLIKDFEGALDYYQQAGRDKDKVLGKTHPSTLMTIMNMAVAYNAMKDFTKAEEMFRLYLDGREKSLGKDHEDTKMCARNLARLLCFHLKLKEKTRELAKRHPHLLTDTTLGVMDVLRGEGK